MTVLRSPQRKLVPDMKGWIMQANLTEGNCKESISTALVRSEQYRGALCEKTARRDLRGGGRVTGRPTSMVFRKSTNKQYGKSKRYPSKSRSVHVCDVYRAGTYSIEEI